MNLLSAIKREQRKLEKELNKMNHRLDGLRSASKALGRTAGREFAGARKRVMSAATRAKITKAARKRWAKVRSQAKKALAA